MNFDKESKSEEIFFFFFFFLGGGGGQVSLGTTIFFNKSQNNVDRIKDGLLDFNEVCIVLWCMKKLYRRGGREREEGNSNQKKRKHKKQ